MDNFQKIKDYLISKNIQFREVSHDKGATAEEYHQALGCTWEQQGKCLLVKTKANGVGSLEFDQFQSLAKEAKKRRLALGEKLGALDNRDGHIQIDGTKVDLFCTEMKLVLSDLDFSDKRRTVQDIIDKVIVKDSGQVEVKGHLPLFDQKLEYEPISRDTHPTIPSLEFKFTFIAPKPRKERTILQRDALGRIITSRSPQASEVV